MAQYLKSFYPAFFFLSNFTFNLLLIFSVLRLKRIWSWEESHKVWIGNSEISSNLCLNVLLANTSTVISRNTQTPLKKASKAQTNKPKQCKNLQWKGWTFSAKVLINLEALQVAAELKLKVQVSGTWYNDAKVLQVFFLSWNIGILLVGWITFLHCWFFGVLTTHTAHPALEQFHLLCEGFWRSQSMFTQLCLINTHTQKKNSSIVEQCLPTISIYNFSSSSLSRTILFFMRKVGQYLNSTFSGRHKNPTAQQRTLATSNSLASIIFEILGFDNLFFFNLSFVKDLGPHREFLFLIEMAVCTILSNPKTIKRIAEQVQATSP